MKTILNPGNKTWESLCRRPAIEQEYLTQTVREILDKLKLSGDKAVIEFTKKFDSVELSGLKVSEKEIEDASMNVSQELKNAINIAKENIDKFHRAQLSDTVIVETTSGVKCWRKNVGIEKIGIYIPGGSAPLFSTILMLGIPANIAECREIILCTPCNKNNIIHPAILYTAQLVGIKNIFKVGGAQAIGAMAYGTESIPKVDKIFGPGNQYVTKAKELVQQQGVAIDLPAGPSELLVIADDTCIPEFVAADLLSQAEHGADSQVVLLTNNNTIAKNVSTEIKKQIENLLRNKIAEKAIENSFTLVLDTIDDCIEFSNRYAPEHLILAVANAKNLSEKIINAGSVFIGNYSCESAGDYASGTNHTLPTNGFAKSYSGVSVDSFVKKITFQEITEEGIKNLGHVIETMAEAEQLAAHKNAVTIRLKSFKQ